MKKIITILSMALAIFAISCGEKTTEPPLPPPPTSGDTSLKFITINRYTNFETANSDVDVSVLNNIEITLTGEKKKDTAAEIFDAITANRTTLFNTVATITDVTEIEEIKAFLNEVVIIRGGNITKVKVTKELTATVPAEFTITVTAANGKTQEHNAKLTLATPSADTTLTFEASTDGPITLTSDGASVNVTVTVDNPNLTITLTGVSPADTKAAIFAVVGNFVPSFNNDTIDDFEFVFFIDAIDIMPSIGNGTGPGLMTGSVNVEPLSQDGGIIKVTTTAQNDETTNNYDVVFVFVAG